MRGDAGVAEADDDRPACRLVGEDGNAVAIIGRVRRALLDAGKREQAAEFVKRAWRARSYGELLRLCFEYVSPN